MAEVGKGIRDSFTTPLAIVRDASRSCNETLELDTSAAAGFDYIETKEDLTKSQRILQYVVEGQRWGSKDWEVLVSPVKRAQGLADRPAGTDSRDAHVGFRRIDLPGAATEDVTKI